MKRILPKLSVLAAMFAIPLPATAVLAQYSGNPPPPPQNYGQQNYGQQGSYQRNQQSRQQSSDQSQQQGATRQQQAQDQQARDQRRSRQQQQTQRAGQGSQLVSVSGQVIRTKQVDIRGGDRKELVALVRASDGRRHIIELGSAGSLPRRGIRSGEQITVRGRPMRRGDYQVILASQVYAQGAWANISRSQQGAGSSGRGYPIAQQARTIQGQVVGTRAVRLRDSETQHLVARVRTDDGRSQVVDLGPSERAQQRLSLREGDRIRVRGRAATIQDRQLLLASSVQTEEGSFTIPRNQQRQQQQRQSGSRSERMQGRPAQQFIEQHDENGDGRISRNELPERMREQFEQLDRNGDSRLSQSELAQHVARMTARVVPLEVTYIWFTDANRGRIDLNDLQQAYKLLQQIDENSDGELAQSELRERREQVVSQWIDSLLERCDENNNGTISQQEARGTLLGQQFDEFDRNSNGQLSRSELRQFTARDGESYVSEEEARGRQQQQRR